MTEWLEWENSVSARIVRKVFEVLRTPLMLEGYIDWFKPNRSQVMVTFDTDMVGL